MLIIFIAPLFFVEFAVATPKGCVKPESYYATLEFDKELENGKYPNGTLVMASCSTGFCIRDGGSHALCLEGQWVPKLGRCPYHCRLSEFPESRNYLYAYPDTYDDPNNDYTLHGTRVTAYCGTPEISIYGGVAIGHPYICHDGGWIATGRHKECDAEPANLP